MTASPTHASIEHSALEQSWPRPSQPKSVICIGAGGIVEAAHLPAYRRVGLEVQGLYDLDLARARSVAEKFGISRVLANLTDAAAARDVVFDLAVPARAVCSVLEALPRGASVLIQKPMGETLPEARRILELCRERSFTAAVNFQLRFSPAVLALRALLKSGLLGEIVDFDVRVNVHTPWELWPFLAGIPRHEVLYHSVHYLDLARALLGDPKRVFAVAVRHPSLPAYSDTRSSTILDYGEYCRALVSSYHAHTYGRTHQVSELKIEGTHGAAVVTLGVNLDYPKGEPDRLDVCLVGEAWENIPLRGSWFTEAFEGPMCNLQRFSAGEDPALESGVEDAYRTMALVEACYVSSAEGGTAVPA